MATGILSLYKLPKAKHVNLRDEPDKEDVAAAKPSDKALLVKAEGVDASATATIEVAEEKKEEGVGGKIEDKEADSKDAEKALEASLFKSATPDVVAAADKDSRSESGSMAGGEKKDERRTPPPSDRDRNRDDDRRRDDGRSRDVRDRDRDRDRRDRDRDRSRSRSPLLVIFSFPTRGFESPKSIFRRWETTDAGHTKGMVDRRCVSNDRKIALTSIVQYLYLRRAPCHWSFLGGRATVWPRRPRHCSIRGFRENHEVVCFGVSNRSPIF